MSLPTGYNERKALPVFDGVVKYFPLALLAVAEVSRVGNDQHNPGQPLHWAREKSTDQMNTALRHMMDAAGGTLKDEDGTWHLAKAAWRILAQLQLDMEATNTNLELLFTGSAPKPATVAAAQAHAKIRLGGDIAV